MTPFREPLDTLLSFPDGVETFALMMQRLTVLLQTHQDETVWQRFSDEIASTGVYAPVMIAMLRFFLLGQQVFVVGPVMQQLLVNTSLKDMPLDEVKFPFPAFWVAVPDSGIKVWNAESGLHDVAGCYVLPGTTFEGEWGVQLVAWGPPHAGRPNLDDACFHFFLPLKGTLSDELDWVLERVVSEQAAPPEFGRPLCEFLVKVVVGLCLYLSTPDAEIHKKSKLMLPRAERRRRERQNASPDPIRKPYTVTYIAPAVEKTATPTMLAELRSPTRQHWVMGHWHKYWVGSREDRKLTPKWLKPYRRGTSHAGIVQRHITVLKEGTLSRPAETNDK